MNLTLLTATSGMSWKVNKKFKVKGQLLYCLSTMTPFTANKNLLATGSFDWNILKKLTWQLAVTANLYHFGTELPGNSLTPSLSG